MNKLLLKFFIIGLSLSMFSCDVIEGPFFESHDVVGEELENPAKVLIFDFTGHTCKSCPKAHKAIEQIKDIYADQIVAVAFHLGYFARTQNGDKFTTDFRTDEGLVLESFYEFVSFPVGTVNSISKESLSPYASWASESAVFIGQQADVAISGSAAINADSSKASLELEIKKQSSDISSLKLAIYLTEDHIISWQKDEDADPMDVEDYEHNHVFRGAIGSVWGEDIDFSETGSKELQFSRSIDLNESWVPDNCVFVIFVYNSESLEIVQVEQIELKN